MAKRRLIRHRQAKILPESRSCSLKVTKPWAKRQKNSTAVKQVTELQSYKGGRHLQQSDAHRDHEPKKFSHWSAGVLAGLLQLVNLAGKDAGAPRFMGSLIGW